MASDEDFWYQVGYALERWKRNPAWARDGLAGIAERARRSSPRRAAQRAADLPFPGSDRLVGAALAALLAPALALWKPRHRPTPASLAAAGLAGAGTAAIVDLVLPMLRGERAPEVDRETADRILSGLADGLVYGAVAEPRLPGPALLKGALFGAAEYAVAPLGGLGRLFGRATPHGRLPFVGKLLTGLDRRERALVEHVVLGVVMATLYRLGSASSGISPEDGEE